MNPTISIVINVTSAQEAILALDELKAHGYLDIVSSPVLAAPGAQGTPSLSSVKSAFAPSRLDILKQEYASKHPQGKGFRLPKALKPLIESGEITYEQVLMEAIAALDAGVPIVNGSTSESIIEYVPEDDGEDTFA